ncbi:peptidase [Phyllobacterium brassicacearum]|uniref:Peptidase n=1 Tax=Phyllobacterium brassicacearum TaxID=314235 RepID=A0A2P7BA93_9HYPH|nr:DUF922 domain-containing protein [Phyllobacterium brassicacearum]PSH63352.1 peptidase [Phyllobacterium brassicacearum]TDQ18206.1 putative secreted Zn-dependent protease [Phyllobacterium brassicacearum]
MAVAKVASLGMALFVAIPTADAAVVLRKYEYFAVNGRTAEDLDRELGRRGPKLETTGQRHPGAVQMRFTNKTKYGSDGKNCRVVDADIVVHAKVFLPRWNQRRTAQPDLALIWDTFSADIKRHEEGHIGIARSAAGNMERQIKALPWRGDCATLKNDIVTLTPKLMRQHNLAQIQFDKVEGINFESRFERLLTYRLIREFGGQTP